MVYCCWSYGFTYTFAIFEFDANLIFIVLWNQNKKCEQATTFSMFIFIFHCFFRRKWWIKPNHNELWITLDFISRTSNLELTQTHDTPLKLNFKSFWTPPKSPNFKPVWPETGWTQAQIYFSQIYAFNLLTYFHQAYVWFFEK